MHPQMKISDTELQNLIDQIPQPRLILGDFNAHNPLWGSTSQNPRGQTIENIITHNNLICMMISHQMIPPELRNCNKNRSCNSQFIHCSQNNMANNRTWSCRADIRWKEQALCRNKSIYKELGAVISYLVCNFYGLCRHTITDNQKLLGVVGGAK